MTVAKSLALLSVLCLSLVVGARVLLKRGTLEVVGFFSVSREFATQRETMAYLVDTICGTLREHFGKELMVYPRGNAEFALNC